MRKFIISSHSSSANFAASRGRSKWLATTMACALSVPATASTVLFTTIDDFADWTGDPAFLSVTPGTSPDLDGFLTNGIAHPTAPRMEGNGGSLTVDTLAAGNFDAFHSAGLSGNAAFLDAVSSASEIELWYTPPTTPTAGNYFVLPIYLNYNDHFTIINPEMVEDSGFGYLVATYNFTMAAGEIAAQRVGNGINYFEFGMFTNSNFENSTFSVDHIVAVPEPATAVFTVLGLGALALLRRRGTAASSHVK